MRNPVVQQLVARLAKMKAEHAAQLATTQGLEEAILEKDNKLGQMEAFLRQQV